MVVHRMERETYVVIYGVQTHCANVWEAIFAHACKCEKMAFTGVLAAFAVILLVLSAVIETSSLFLIAAAAFVCRDCIAGNGESGQVQRF